MPPPLLPLDPPRGRNNPGKLLSLSPIFPISTSNLRAAYVREAVKTVESMEMALWHQVIPIAVRITILIFTLDFHYSEKVKGNV